MNRRIDVVIVGAGPYGLSLAAHLRGRGLEVRQFGRLMDSWISAMPDGMCLKSEGFASCLSDPAGAATLEAYCRSTGEPYQDVGLPVPVERFVAYGTWFGRQQAPEVEDTTVTEIARDGEGFQVTTAAPERIAARNVVIATGVSDFAHVPKALIDLPDELCTHVAAHADLSTFRGRSVVVIGAGQSALESATLLHESGADVHLLARRPALVWNSTPKDKRNLLQRARRPVNGLGVGWKDWFYSTKPYVFRHLPRDRRLHLARTALGPAGSWWLRPRMEGNVASSLGQVVTQASPTGNKVTLRTRDRDGNERDLVTEHVIAATGYRPKVARLPFLDDDLRARLRLLGEAPWVGADFQSNVPGLFFVGASVASTFGPVMRFVYGADFAARTVSRRLVRSRPGRAG